MIAAKYKIIVPITRQPPQYLTKVIKSNESIRVIKTIDKEIGHVLYISEIDS